jgi:trehalose/maltose transport system substrate-binding protein
MASVIQAGQRAAGRKAFWGFVWPGHQPEGLTCTALEWQHSEGGGCIIETDGRVSVANPQAAAALDRAARWVGVISPPDFNAWTELDAESAWENDSAAFMRIWSVYPHKLLPEPLRSATTVTVLPRGAARHAATLGGWPMVVHGTVRQQQEAYSLVREIASPAARRLLWQWDKARFPVNLSLWQEPDILAAYPHLPEIYQLVAGGGLAVRPICVAGKLYGQVSTLYARTVAAILSGQKKAAPALAELAHALQDAGGWPISS